MTEPALITYPARPVNGGRLEDAPPKVGPWVYQPKIADWRAIVHVPSKRIWNRHGEPMSIEDKLQTALMILTGSRFDWLDVGVMENANQLFRNSIVIFDWIPDSNSVGRTAAPHSERRAWLEHDFDLMPWDAGTILSLRPHHRRERVFLIPEWQKEPLGVYEQLQRNNAVLAPYCGKLPLYEGLVAKRTDKPYPVQLISPTRETPWMMKHRFDQ